MVEHDRVWLVARVFKSKNNQGLLRLEWKVGVSGGWGESYRWRSMMEDDGVETLGDLWYA